MVRVPVGHQDHRVRAVLRQPVEMPGADRGIADDGQDLRARIYSWPLGSRCAVDRETVGESYDDPDNLNPANLLYSNNGDVPATLKLIDQHRPELIIFGKSMVISKEPVAQVREFLDQQGIDLVADNPLEELDGHNIRCVVEVF